MSKPLTRSNLIRIGLALVFLANALMVFFAPSEFIELIEKSFLVNLLPVSTGTFVIIIGINDALIAAFLFLGAGIRRVAIWASIWIIGVMFVRGAPLEIMEEAGFLFMAIALAVNNKTVNNKNDKINKNNYES